MTAADWTLRGILAVNFVLLVLTFVPAFSGIGPEPGLADRLWGNVRLGGWRADVAWMFVSSLFVFARGLRWPREPGARRATAILCWGWLPCFVVYLRYTVIHMFG
jgi:hypothetical protein